MKKHYFIPILLSFLSVGFTSVSVRANSITIATFADPSPNNSNPLFTINFNTMTLDGGWSDTKTGLTLQIPCNGHTFVNAWFDVTDEIALSPVIPGMLYSTGPGEINFYKDNTPTNPLVVVNFDSSSVSPYGFGANEVLFTLANVTFTGSEITGSLSQEQFAFSFTNLAHLDGSTSWDDGFTATASFTSSAVPEPATVCLLGLGGLALLRKKRRFLGGHKSK